MHDARVATARNDRPIVNGLAIAVSSVLGIDLAFLAGAAWGRGRTVALLVVFTVLTGYADSQGFVHAAKVWDGSQVAWRHVLLSAAGFAVGVVAYWIVVRFAGQLGVRSASLQTMGWFAVTIAAVVLTDPGHHRWQLVDTATAAVVVGGLGLLLYRTSA